MLVQERFHVLVDEPEFPVLGKQGGNRQKTKGRGRVFRSHDVADILIIPEAEFGEFGLDQQAFGKALI